MENNIDKYLTIVLITYNRSKYLFNTLLQFSKSPFINCKIVIQNNCSTDDTIEVLQKFHNLFPQLNIVTNKFNIGGSANVLRAVENSDTEYTWIISDDDSYDFSDCNDIITQIQKTKYNLIQVGGHNDRDWRWGMREATPLELEKDHYPYFKYSSFIGSSIFRTKYFVKHIIEGYDNIINGYPHMPYLLNIYKEDQKIYISKKRMIIADNFHNACYTGYQMLNWWLATSKLLHSSQEQRICFVEQYDMNHIYYKAMILLFYRCFKGKNIKQYLNILSLFNPFQVVVIFCYLLFISTICLIRKLRIHK
jgi:glycosyltransferase involved in cell wall biosynthesis